LNHLTVTFIDTHEHPVSTLTFSFDPTARVTLQNDKQKAVSAVKKGEKLKFWMPENSIGLYAQPGAAASQHFALVGDGSTTER
jgi:hypothetical protein